MKGFAIAEVCEFSQNFKEKSTGSFPLAIENFDIDLFGDGNETVGGGLTRRDRHHRIPAPLEIIACMCANVLWVGLRLREYCFAQDEAMEHFRKVNIA